MNRPLSLATPFALGAGLAAGAVVLALAGGTALAAWANHLHAGRSSDDRAAEEALRDEIQAMVESGLPPEDPKVALLEDELTELEALADAVAEPDPGFDPDELESLRAGSARAFPPHAPDPTEEWEDGEVECEPLPGRLSVEDIADANCYVERQPDGSIRYVAVAPDGTERDAFFATD